MSKSIIIVGALPNDPSRKCLLDALAEKKLNVQWDWIWANAVSSRPEMKYLRPLLAKKDRQQLGNTIIVKLQMLDGATRYTFHQLGCDIVEADTKVQSTDDLITWLLSPEANLIPRLEWLVTVREAGFLAIVSKLIRGCRWSKDVSGHAFLKANDLMNQAPVQRSGFEPIKLAARELITKLIACDVILEKGAEQGNTPLEYAINTKFLAKIKKALLNESFSGLNNDSFATIITFLKADKSKRDINALDGIVNAQTLQQCRTPHHDETKS